MRRPLAYLILLVSTLFALGCTSQSQDGNEQGFVPADFEIPNSFVCDEFRLRPLDVSDAEADYEAVMESKVELRALFGGDWPEDDFSLEQNRSDLKEHQKAFQDRESFTYSVVAVDQSRILGCVYIHPCDEADAQVIFWVRSSEKGQGLDQILQGTLQNWLTSAWPFNDVKFPGRE